MRKRSLDSVRIAYLDKKRAVEEIRRCAEELAAVDRNVLAVGLFGSLARGDALPTSDADVLVALKEHVHGRWFDRIPQYAEAFSTASVPVEVFPYTIAELERMTAGLSPFLERIFEELIPLGGDAGLWAHLQEKFRRNRGTNPEA